MPTLTLSGCTPIPLAHYLKALGILRLVADASSDNSAATAAWTDDQLRLTSCFDQASLVSFLLRDYQPTPVLAPWNGGSGFYAKDNHEGIDAIMASNARRFSQYQSSILSARRAVNALKLKEKPDGTTKGQLLCLCRNTFPDPALAWLDAVFVLGRNGPKYPPLLGTGGNDGRLEFTNNFMQRLLEVIDPASGEPSSSSESWLLSALFGLPAPGSTTKAPIGQFYPGAAGGANSTSGFDAPSAANPWDFILMIEGALVFAASSVKRLDSANDGALVYPFCVRQTGIGYASASTTDEIDARCEMWLPLWDKPTTLTELRAIFGEGRAQVAGHAVRNGVDFSRAVVSLGVDRGITAFQRYGFQVRNGLAYFATPLDRITVRRDIRTDLLSDIDPWLDRLRQKAGSQANPAAPASIARSLNGIDRAIIDLCRNGSPDSIQSILVSLGQAERALAKSMKWSVANYVHPLCGLTADWLTGNEKPEFRLASSLAGMRSWFSSGRETLWLRQHLEPSEIITANERTWVKWAEQPSNDVAWHDGDLTDTLNEILARRIIRVEKAGVKGWPDWTPCYARLEDIAAFIESRTDDALISDLLWGLSLVDWQAIKREAPGTGNSSEIVPSSFYALLKLCFRRPGQDETSIPVVPAIHNRSRSGDGRGASQLAARRLRASGYAPLVSELPMASAVARRTAAALLFPISSRDLRLLEQTILKQPENQNA
jgi:CRISPR-associated protein Csx17